MAGLTVTYTSWVGTTVLLGTGVTTLNSASTTIGFTLTGTGTATVAGAITIAAGSGNANFNSVSLGGALTLTGATNQTIVGSITVPAFTLSVKSVPRLHARHLVYV
jgi:hypothetical protein